MCVCMCVWGRGVGGAGGAGVMEGATLQDVAGKRGQIKEDLDKDGSRTVRRTHQRAC